LFRICHILIFFIVPFALLAQNPSFTAQVSDNRVQVGEDLQVVFTLTNVSGGSLSFPQMDNDFTIKSGPNQSQSQNVVMSNGNISQTLITSFSFIISPKKEGRLTIGAASIVIGKQKLETQPIVIDVEKAAPRASSQGGAPNQYASPIDGDDVFVRAFVSKTKNAYVGEQIHVTYKLYSRPQPVDFSPKELLQTFDGFWNQKEDLNKPKQYTMETETVDGIAYNVVELYHCYLFPQRSGTLTLDPVELEVLVRQQTKRPPRSFIEQFFGSPGYEDRVVKLKSRPTKIEVKELPEEGKPENFSGAVGSFSCKTEISTQKLKANESLTLKLTLSGKGNIKLAEPVKLDLPESFEVYEPKISEKISLNGNVTGTKVYEYLIIPREAGNFTLSKLNYSYFDPEKKQYITLPSPDIQVTVLPGDENSSAQVIVPRKQGIDQKQNDIRYLKNDLKLQQASEEFFGSVWHYLLLIIPFAGFLTGLYLYRQRIALNRDVRALKQRKAARLARKQLAVAEKHMRNKQKELFFDEVFAALNRYISDKLSIPVADLSKETIRLSLINRQVKEATITKLIDTLDACEYARYAPAAVGGNLQTVYKDTIDLITTIEEEIKTT